jgi:hypothetical protein
MTKIQSVLEFVKLLRCQGIDSQPCGIDSLELTPGLLNVYKFGLGISSSLPDREYFTIITVSGAWNRNIKKSVLRIRIRDPCLFDTDSGIQNRFFPDPGSQIPNLYF